MSRAGVAGAVLAGGRSRRMGSDKGLLPFGRRRLIDAALDAVRAQFPEILIVANDPPAYAGLGVRVVSDRVPGLGPLGGVHAALRSASSPHVFCVACDMPFLNPAVISHLAVLAPGYDAVVPRSEAGCEPLHAIYGRSCLPEVERMVRDERYRLDALFSAVRVRWVDADEIRPLDPLLRSFVNVNTPEELEAARRFLSCEGEGQCAT